MITVHGHGGYTNHGCRCSICTTANREYMAAYYDRAGKRDQHNARARRRRAEYKAILAAYRVSSLSTFTDGRLFGEALMALDEALTVLDRMGYFNEPLGMQL